MSNFVEHFTRSFTKNFTREFTLDQSGGVATLVSLLSGPSSTDYGEWTDERTTDPVWVEDFEGLLREIPVGELVFEGGRVVKNLFQQASDLSEATPSPGTSVKQADGSYLFTTSASGTLNHYYGDLNCGLFSFTENNKYIFSVKAKYGGYQYLAIHIHNSGGYNTTAIFDVLNGSATTSGGHPAETLSHSINIQDLGSGWYRCAFCFTRLTSANRTISFSGSSTYGGTYNREGTFDGSSGIYLKDAQAENSSGRSNEEVPSEYVSVGVGDGTELVTNGTFDTDTTGWTYEQQATWQSGGTVKVEDIGGVDGVLGQVITTISGLEYVVSFDLVDHNGGVSTDLRLRLDKNGWGYDIAQHYLGAQAKGGVTLTYTFTATSAITHMYFLASGTDHWMKLDNVSVQKATTGFAYKDTANGNTVDASNVVTEATGAALDPVPYLLHVPSATNLVTYSSEFDNAAWTKNICSITANAAIAPDGMVTADKWSSTATSYTSIYDTITVTASETYTLSVYAKASDTDIVSLEARFSSGDDVNIDAWFDLTNETSTNVDVNTTTSIEVLDNGWYRCSMTKPNPSTGTSCIVIISGTSTANGAHPAGTKSFYIWGAKLGEGSFPTNYIPTSGSTETRNATDYQLALTKDYQRGAYDSPELVANGTFDTDISNWTSSYVTPEWDPSGGIKFETAASTLGGIEQTYSFTAGQTYQLTFDVTEVSTTGISIYNYSGGQASPVLDTDASVGTYTDTFTAVSTGKIELRIVNPEGDYVVLDNISVKRVLSDDEQWATYGSEQNTNVGLTDWTGINPADWTQGSNDGSNYWEEHAEGARLVAPANNPYMEYAGLVNGQVYAYEIEISNSVSGSVKLTSNWSTVATAAANGTHTGTFTSTGTTIQLMRSTNPADLVISNISVKPVSYNYEEFKQSEGTLVFDWVPEYDITGGGGKALFGLDNNVSGLSVFYHGSTGITTYDGTNTPGQNVVTYSVGDKIRVAVTWSIEASELRIGFENITTGLGWTWDDAVAYDGQFTSDDIAYLFYVNPNINQLHNLQIYNQAMTTTEIEALE